MSRKHFHQIEHPPKPPASTHLRVWRPHGAAISRMPHAMVGSRKKQIYDHLSCGKDGSWWGNVGTVREIRRSNAQGVEILRSLPQFRCNFDEFLMAAPGGRPDAQISRTSDRANSMCECSCDLVCVTCALGLRVCCVFARASMLARVPRAANARKHIAR